MLSVQMNILFQFYFVTTFLSFDYNFDRLCIGEEVPPLVFQVMCHFSLSVSTTYK